MVKLDVDSSLGPVSIIAFRLMFGFEFWSDECMRRGRGSSSSPRQRDA